MDAWFEEYNSRFFDGRLSKWEVKIGFPPDIYDVGSPPGYCDRGEGILYIKFGEKEKARKTLMHEMVHASVGDGHGKQFRNELNRVKELGAPVDSSDLKPRSEPTGNDVRELIIEFIRHRLELRDAQEETAYVFGFKSRVTLIRRFPKATQIDQEIIEFEQFEEPRMKILGRDVIEKH